MGLSITLPNASGGVLSCTHTGEDIAAATAAFEETVIALRQEGLIRTL